MEPLGPSPGYAPESDDLVKKDDLMKKTRRNRRSNVPIEAQVYCPDILRYRVTDLISPDNAKFWTEFGFGKYLIIRFSDISGSCGLAMGILARPRLAKMVTKLA